MAPGACGEPSSTGITGVVATIDYYPVSSRRSRHRCAALCLGESPAQARLKCLDLCCSFEALVKAEYGGHDHLDFVAWNYVEKRGERRNGDLWNYISEGPPEFVGGHVRALRGLVPMSLVHGRSPNCTCVQLPGSSCQTGSLPLGCPEVTTWGGAARLDPHPRGSGRGSSA